MPSTLVHAVNSSTSRRRRKSISPAEFQRKVRTTFTLSYFLPLAHTDHRTLPRTISVQQPCLPCHPPPSFTCKALCPAPHPMYSDRDLRLPAVMGTCRFRSAQVQLRFCCASFKMDRSVIQQQVRLVLSSLCRSPASLLGGRRYCYQRCKCCCCCLGRSGSPPRPRQLLAVLFPSLSLPYPHQPPVVRPQIYKATMPSRLMAS